MSPRVAATSWLAGGEVPTVRPGSETLRPGSDDAPSIPCGVDGEHDAEADPWRRPRPCRVVRLGRLAHADADALQTRVHARRFAGESPDSLLLLEHPGVYTAGSAFDPAHLLVPRAQLEREGHPVREIRRGGSVTWHGPGQLACWPIFDLSDGRRDIHAYLRRLEQALVAVAARFGVAAWREEGRTGLWCRGGKLAAIGIRVSRWVTMHGTAFNVDPDLARFDAIVPCGLADGRPTSLRRELGWAPSLEDVARAHAEAFAQAFHLRLEDGDDVV